MGSILSCLSNVMYLSEKVSLYLTCTSLICCLVCMFVVTLGMGIGLGYNYCFVDMKTRVKYVPPHYQYHGSIRWPYIREGSPQDPESFEEAEADSMRAQITAPPNDPELPAFSNSTSPNNTVAVNLTTSTVYSISSPDDDDDDDVTIVFSNETSVADTSNDTTETDETTTNETAEITEETSETTGSSSVESSSENQPDMINEIDEPTPEAPINNSDPNSRRVKKLVIPISGLDLISLLSKLRAENKNYSLQIVTT